jgi:hypothetical protein
VNTQSTTPNAATCAAVSSMADHWTPRRQHQPERRIGRLLASSTSSAAARRGCCPRLAPLHLTHARDVTVGRRATFTSVTDPLPCPDSSRTHCMKVIPAHSRTGLGLVGWAHKVAAAARRQHAVRAAARLTEARVTYDALPTLSEGGRDDNRLCSPPRSRLQHLETRI